MSWLSDVLGKNKEINTMLNDFDFFGIETNQRAYLKKVALETCINFIARTVSLSEFRMMKKDTRQYNDWHYLLNIRPNTDQSAADFWQDFVYKLILDNEVLAILTDQNDLLIADHFDRVEYAVYPDVFKNVNVKDYTFQRSFQMDEVIYITYNNEELTKFMSGIFKDYTQLFSRMIETNMFSNQIRATAEMESAQNLEGENLTKLQSFMDKLFGAFRKNAFAIVPKIKGFNYTEIADGSNNGRSVEELSKLKKDLIDHVANILGIPTALVRGDMGDYETSIKAYIKFCISPLIKKIEDELNAKLIEKKNFLSGEKIEVTGVKEKDIIDHAEAVDKLVASGAFTRNEVRKLFGAERSNNPELDEFVITKNYQSANSIEGGDKNEK
ncbi:TPA: phage portal protein [Bacillus thuringiensis]|uniref:Phage portal protein n=1 Tax=Bacillus thuringiensis serovar iberica TaxID=180866 RepID=A0A9X6LLL8_BACTU|nr:phage portal protein [Bacillus thuringiensis]MEB9626228.1 phage portal protein [Bacillus cereus]OUB48370.1 phage portal protein [Bacillus thuringiensis serovar iberica]HDR5354004.1 phage portal protein [Bacillus thuringiensis]